MCKHARFCLTACLMLAAALARAGEAPVPGNADAAAPPADAYYRWIDSQGRVQYTDFEPVGIPAQRIPLAPAAGPDEAPVLSPAGEQGQPDPFHDQDQQILPIEHIGPCADARQQLAVLYAPLPVYRDQTGVHRPAWRGDAYQGRRDYLDAETRTAAIESARNAVLAHCSDPDAFRKEVQAFREKAGRN